MMEQFNQNKEFQYLVSFAAHECFDTALARERIRSLWTAYCLRNSFNVKVRPLETFLYLDELLAIWSTLQSKGEADYWDCFSEFCNYMSQYLE